MARAPPPPFPSRRRRRPALLRNQIGQGRFRVERGDKLTDCNCNNQILAA